MFRRSSSQGSLWDSEFQMSDRKRGRLEKTWAKVFRERCWPLIDEEMFRPLYCEDNGTPCKSVRLVVAVTLLRHLFDLTQEETQYHVDFDLRWHLALGLDPCDDDDYVSERTLRYFEVKLVEHELVGVLFTELTDQLLDRLGVKTGQQRLDTTHLLPNVARLSRLGLFCETHRVLLKALRREAASLLERRPPSLRRRYLREDGTDSSYDDARASDSRRRLGVAARDAFRLREALRGVALPADSAAAYAVLTRLVDEHCEVVPEAQAAAAEDAAADLPAVPVVVQEAKTLTGAVLQTPHDPGVTYSGHKGQGYEGLLAETCDPDNAVQLITPVSLERSGESDAARVLPTVAALAAREIAPETLLADTSFGSQANYEACAVRGIELIAPLPGAGGEASALAAADAEAGFHVQCFPGDLPSVCPAGVEAQATVVRQTAAGPVALVHLPAGACEGCTRRASCPLVTTPAGQTVALLEIGETLRDDRRAFVRTAAFQDAYRPRAGIEGTNSELKRGQGLGDVRVRGQARMELALTMRVLACNVKRALQYWGKQAKKAAIIADVVWQALQSSLQQAMGMVRDPLPPVWLPGSDYARVDIAAA
jgi:hypothetical protein